VEAMGGILMFEFMKNGNHGKPFKAYVLFSLIITWSVIIFVPVFAAFAFLICAVIAII
jgi:hypothetical protein